VAGLAIVWMGLFCDYLLMTIVIPIFPELGASTFATGALFSAKAAVQIVSSPFVAQFVDRYGLSLLSLGLVLESGATLVFVFTDSYGPWMAARASQGLASALMLSSGFLHVQRMYSNDDDGLGSAMSTVTTGIITGVTLGPPLGGVLYEVEPWLPFALLAALMAVVAVSSIVFIAKGGEQFEPEHEIGSREEGGGDQESVAVVAGLQKEEELSVNQMAWGMVSDKHILVTLVSLLLCNAAISCLESTLGDYLEREVGMTSAEVGCTYVVTALPSVLASKVAGGLGNRFGRYRVLLGGMAIQGCFFALGPKDVFAMEVVSLIGLGVGMGLVDGCAPAMLSQVNLISHQGSGVIYTLQTAFIQLGAPW